jgi:hypothetical protein
LPDKVERVKRSGVVGWLQLTVLGGFAEMQEVEQVPNNCPPIWAERVADYSQQASGYREYSKFQEKSGCGLSNLEIKAESQEKDSGSDEATDKEDVYFIRM